MKVAVVAPVSLAEPRRGDAVRIAGLTAQLARSAEVVLFSSTPPGSLSIPNAELPVRAHWYIPAVRYSDVRTAYRTVFRGLAYDSARFGYDVEAMHAPPESFDVAYLHLPRSRDIWTQLKSRFPAGLEAAWVAAARGQDYQVEILERVVDSAAKQLELPAGPDILGGFAIGIVLQIAPRGNLITVGKATERLLVIGVRLARQ